MARVDPNPPESSPLPTKPTLLLRKLFRRESVGSAPPSPRLPHGPRGSNTSELGIPPDFDLSEADRRAGSLGLSQGEGTQSQLNASDANNGHLPNSTGSPVPRISLIRRMSRKVVPQFPRPQSLKRRDSERRTNLSPVEPSLAERRAASADRRSQLSQHGSHVIPAQRLSAPEFTNHSLTSHRLSVPPFAGIGFYTGTENHTNNSFDNHYLHPNHLPNQPANANIPHGQASSSSHLLSPYAAIPRHSLDELLDPFPGRLSYTDLNTPQNAHAPGLREGREAFHHHEVADGASQRSASPSFYSGHVPPSAPSIADSHSVTTDQIEAELDKIWILNLSMHYRDRSKREKFFITYRDPDSGDGNAPTSRRVTVSVDYRDAPPESLEAEMMAAETQRGKCARIYQAVRESLPEIRFYDTVTNLKLQTNPEDMRLHVHVVEDLNEIIKFPPVRLVQHLGCRRIRERDIDFDSHMSGFVFKVRVNGQVLIKKEIPGSESIEEFLYEINALTRLNFSHNVIHLYGVVVDDNDQHVRGVLVSYADHGALADVIFDYRNERTDEQPGDDNEGGNPNLSPKQQPDQKPRSLTTPGSAVALASVDANLPDWLANLPWSTREKWARQIVCGLADIHETGFVQGDFTLSNIVIDSDGDAKIIDINRRGCPSGWHPPEATPLVETKQALSMYIGVKSDLFQLGMVLWALAMLVDEPERERRPLRFRVDSDIPEWYQRIVETCLSDDPRRRLHASLLLDLFPNDPDGGLDEANNGTTLGLGLSFRAPPSSASAPLAATSRASTSPLTYPATAASVFSSFGPTPYPYRSPYDGIYPRDTYMDIAAPQAGDYNEFGHARGRSPASMQTSDPGVRRVPRRVSSDALLSVAGSTSSEVDEGHELRREGFSSRAVSNRESLAGVGALSRFDTFGIEGLDMPYFDMASFDALVGRPDEPGDRPDTRDPTRYSVPMSPRSSAPAFPTAGDHETPIDEATPTAPPPVGPKPSEARDEHQDQARLDDNLCEEHGKAERIPPASP